VATALPHVNFEDPVTAHMHQDFTALYGDLCVSDALAWLRDHPPQSRIIYFYVTDAEGRLQGVVPTRRLLLSSPSTLLADIMVREVIALPSHATVLEACEFFILHRLLAFPVVDEHRRLLGTVDVELYTTEVGRLEDARERDDLFQLLGVRVAGVQQASVLTAFRYRFPWLGCNLLAGILAALLAGVYEEELSRVVELSFFIPVVLNLAESVSSQSVIFALQLLHGRRPSWSDMADKLRSELGTGLLLGLSTGAIIGLVALIWRGQPLVALCLLGGIAGGVTGAAMLGLALPLLLRLLKLDPSVAAGPVALASADVITILLYLNLARWLLS
jgi:magnesium transporter